MNEKYYHITHPSRSNSKVQGLSPIVFPMKEAVRLCRVWKVRTGVTHGIEPCRNPSERQKWSKEAFDMVEITTLDLRLKVASIERKGMK